LVAWGTAYHYHNHSELIPHPESSGRPYARKIGFDDSSPSGPLKVKLDGNTTPAGALPSIAHATICFGAIVGLLEGVGLLAFQHINFARWGPMIHVSPEIIWISPIVDLIFFSLVSAIIGLVSLVVSQILPRFSAYRAVIFVLSFLAVYDWLTLTARLYHRACLLLTFGAAVAFGRWLARHQTQAAHFWKRTSPWAIAAVALAFVVIQGGGRWREHNALAALPPAASGSPNVLVVVIDTLRADHVSAYGYPRPTTPNLDRLAQQGVLFENAVSASSWSLPSHVSLVTGRYLHDHKVGQVQEEPWLGWGQTGLGGFPTIGEALEQRGYRTGAFSANRTFFSHTLGFGRGFMHFEDYFSSLGDSFVRTLYGREFARIYLIRTDRSLGKRIIRRLGWTSLLDQDAEGSGSYGGAFEIRKHADVVNAEVLRWIDRDRQRPFFAFLNYFDVHDPYGGPQSYPQTAWPQVSDIDRYDTGLKYSDDCLGRLLAALEQRGLANNTLVIVTSDHGEALGQHFLLFHGGALYWELVHVPLVISYPGHVPAGVRVAQPVTNAALPATILALLNGGENSFPGPPLDVLWRAGQPATQMQNPISELAQNQHLGKRYARIDQQIPTAATGYMKTLITTQWQLVLHQRADAQLYNWVRDPGELNDLAKTPEGESVMKILLPQIEAQTSPSR
jgi:arylsulfatase A-like enzyme